MLNLGIIIANIKKGQSALKVKSVLVKLEQNYQRVKGNIKITGCKKEPNKITVYTTIPSDSTAGVLYDTVLEFHTTGHLSVSTPFKAYSNSPSFAYNFSYVFNTNGSLLWPEKYPAEFKKMTPKTRNPYMFAGFDKHIFAAVRFIGDYGLNNIISELDGTIPPVKSFDDKVRELRTVRGGTSNV